MYFSELLQYIINGIAQGAIYALIALGYTMVYGILKLINFAHGEFYMVGAFLGVIAIGTLGMPVWLAIPVVMAASGGLAVLVERIAYRPLRNAGRVAPLITALGVSIFLLEAARVVFGAQPRPFPPVMEQQIYDLAFLGESFDGVIVQKTQLVILAVSLSLMFLLRWVVQSTKVGRAMRALSMDFDASRLMGVPLNRTIAFTFFIGAALAGVAGILVGMHYNNVETYMGQLAGLKAFTAAVLGGIGVIPGAVLGAFALGIIENLVVGYMESSYRDAIAFAILIFVLMVRPWGLMGKPERVKV
jgi:branched-chain amino acid transport system permease protein